MNEIETITMAIRLRSYADEIIEIARETQNIRLVSIAIRIKKIVEQHLDIELYDVDDGRDI